MCACVCIVVVVVVFISFYFKSQQTEITSLLILTFGHKTEITVRIPACKDSCVTSKKNSTTHKQTHGHLLFATGARRPLCLFKPLASLIATMCDTESHPDLEAYVSVSGLHSNHLQITFLLSNIHKLGTNLSRGSIILPWIKMGASAAC